MTTSSGRSPHLVLLLVTVGQLACSSDSSAPPQDDTGDSLPPGGSVDMTIAGSVSFAGPTSLNGVGILGRNQPVDVQFSRVEGQESMTVHILVPSTIYHGVGQYTCGTALNVSSVEYPYCSIWIKHSPDGAVLGTWTTQSLEIAPGVWGALPDCTVTVTEVGELIRGAVDCGNFLFAGSDSHPDAAHELNRLTGTWHFQPLAN